MVGGPPNGSTKSHRHQQMTGSTKGSVHQKRNDEEKETVPLRAEVIPSPIRSVRIWSVDKLDVHPVLVLPLTLSTSIAPKR